MTFHQSREFADALQAAAGHFKMRPIFIEKDYWVTYVLKNLSQSNYINEVVFKGGTSLSKAHNCIDRFSEDIDLALVKKPEMSGNQLNKKMKSIEVAITKDLEYFQHEKEEKYGRNRRTFYHYTKALSDVNFGQVKDHIQLEINTFTNPAPHEEIKINSYVAQFLEQAGFTDRIIENQLDPFIIKVLTRERTFFEKLLSLVRLSYDGTEKLKGKIRHFYDLHKLLGQEDLTLLHSKNFNIIDLVKADDSSNEFFKGEWLNKPLSSSPLFGDVEKSWKELEGTYKKSLADLVWSELPDPRKIESSLLTIRQFVAEYDRK